MSHLATARKYLKAGISVLPAILDEKRPRLSKWEKYQGQLPLDHQLVNWFSDDDDFQSRGTAVCVVTGAVSANLELIDFDFKAELFLPWRQLVHAESPGLYARLVVETSQSGGKHVAYRCESTIPASLKLAQRVVIAPSEEPIEICGKKYNPRFNRNTGIFEVLITLIETRGEGACFLCAPSAGYVPERGSLESLPVITEGEREILIGAARALNEALPPIKSTPTNHTEHGRPGDDYNEHGDFRGLLIQHGWSQHGGSHDCEYWRRPGKEVGQSASIRGRVFYNFSSNAAPFEPDTSYSPFGVYALLEHNGDFKAAATAIRGGPGKQNSTLNDDYYDSLASNSSEQYQSSTMEQDVKRESRLTIRTARQLVREFPSLRPPLIDGLLRQGETMNLISAPKFGKSWLVLGLVICIASGRPWLGRFRTIRGKVLLIDNELHSETLSSRIPRVGMALGIPEAEYDENISVVNLRGSLMDLKALCFELLTYEPGTFDLIVIDAWYRCQPTGSDENSNGDVSALYNLLDSVAAKLGCAFVCVHHSNKGNQSGKSVTDVGSGAGAQARAPDTHLIMRQHEVDNAVVVDAAVRSWAPLIPFVMRWEFPVWEIDEHLLATDLRKDTPRRGSSTGKNDKPDPNDVRAAKEHAARTKVLEAYRLFPGGETQNVLRTACGLSGEKFTTANDALIASGQVEKFPGKKNKQPVFMYRLTEGGQVGQVGQNNTQSSQSRGVGQVPPPLGGTVRPTTPPPDDDLPKLSDFPDMDGDYR